MNHIEKSQRNQKTYSVYRVVTFLIIVLISSIIQPIKVFSQTTTEQVSVSGKIVDDKKEAIIGASVLVVGTSIGTISDIDGNFSLKAPNGSTLSVSYIGFVSQRIKISGSAPLNIVLKEENAKLNEVVVVGYNTVKRANVAGSVTSLDMKEVQDIPTVNLASALAGTMPGIHVSEPTGNPIGSAKVSIRINGTFSTTDEPLYVIDGFIRSESAFNMLDASEVENISVLKDASAAIYGVRGANGVVIVTTKRGKEGKLKVSYSGSLGVNQGINVPKMMSAYEQGVALNDLWNQEVMYKGADPTKKNFFSDAELNHLKTVDYNWLEEGWHDSFNNRHTLNISGGSKDVRYFLGGSYMYNNGNFSKLDVNRYGFRMGLDANITKQLSGSISMDFNQRITNMPYNQADTEADRMYGTFSELVRTPRYIPSYINGLPVNYTSANHALELFNSGSYKKSKSAGNTLGMSLKYDFENIKGLKAIMSANYSTSSNFGKRISNPYYLYGFVKDPEFTHMLSDVQLPFDDKNYRRVVYNGDNIQESASYSYSYQINPQLSYTNHFGKNNIDAMLMYEQSESGGNGLSETRQTVIIPGYEVMEGYSSTGQTTASDIKNLSRRQSFIGRFNYTYDEKYILEATARYEASTNFAPGYRWGVFPSASVAWRISQEEFFEKMLPVIDNLKVRASYGRLGNDKATENQWRTSYAINGSTLIGGGVLSANLKPQNGGLVYYISTWEKTDSYNGGIDMRLFNQVTLAIDGFYKHTFDILDNPQSEFPQSSGITGAIPKINYGVQNAWGGELELGWNKQINKDWSVRVKANYAYAMNKVIKKYQNPGVKGTWKDEEGKVSQGEVGYVSRGIARNQQDINDYIAYLKTNYEAYYGTTGTVKAFSVSEADMKPGMLMFEDVGSASYKDEDGVWHDGKPDGIINENDERIISKFSFNPHNYGFTLGCKWKDITLDALFTGAFGSSVLFEKGFWTGASGGGRTGDFLSEYSNQLSEWYGNYWTEENPNAIYPRLDDYSNRQFRSTFWMRNGHELRLKTINLSYSLPTKIAKIAGLEQLRVYMQASNILTIINPYPYKDASVGFWSDYPMIRTINLGLNITL
ncbi:MAG TPA: TonB-dependent receptor [Paludibacter sp.]|nr:TonB-dependent receptor [Paludibacter sp.]